MKALVLGVALVVWAGVALALPPFTFSNIDGGTHQSADWAGRPVLVVNTASLCGYTPQYEELQALHDAYGAKGLVVLAVPSDDFAQELASTEAVKDFCEVNFALTLPMTDITPVKGVQAHPFYAWVQGETGFQPRWNFNKVLIAPDGSIAGTWGSRTSPRSRAIEGRIRAMF